MRQVLWTDDAVGNLEAIVTYISASNPPAAARLAERLIAVADSRAEYSERGREASEGLRYRVDGDRVVILRIRHGAQERDS